MAKDEQQEKKQTPLELLREMRLHGVEQKLPGTQRIVKLRAVDAPTLLREGKMPDILTPLVVKSIYQELSDTELRAFLGDARSGIDDALTMLDTIEFVVQSCIMDDTEVQDLTLAEKRWIFRLVMGPAELLITFRWEEELDVEHLAEGDEVQQAAE